MSVFTFLLFLGIFIFTMLFILLVWGIKSGQMDDLVTPGERVLWEDPKDESKS